MRRTHLTPRSRLTEELALSTNAPVSSAYRRSRKLPFEIRLRRGGRIRAEHLAIFERFYNVTELTGYLAEFAFALKALLTAPWIRILEARLEGKLEGILVFDQPFESCIHAITLARNGGVASVADRLVASLVDFAGKEGVATVNLGASPSQGHRQFKLKWGAKRLVPPYYYVEWSRRPFPRRCFTGWGARLVRLAP